MKTPETDEDEQAPARDTGRPGNYTCGHCMRWFPNMAKRTKHMIEKHPEATAWVPTPP
jgi:hypothetical protein